MVEAGVAAGKGPRDIALDLVGRLENGKRAGGIIGLTSQQAGYVINARKQLEALDRAYFDRALRDARFDRLVAKAIRDGKPLSKADIDRIVGKYADRLLRHRGENIARTESLNAYRAGNMEALRQLIDTGKVKPEQVTREWDATLDSRVRLQHAAMDNVSVKGLAPFTLPDGTRMMHPGDASLGAGPGQIINCRCFHRIKIKYL